MCLLGRRWARFVVFLLLALLVRAQESGVCSESVIVSVRDHRGQQVADLLPSSFRATLGSSVLNIRSASFRTSSPRIVLLLDRSGSMNQSFASTLAKNFVALNAGKAHIAVVLFSDHVIDTINFDTPRAEILQKLSKLQELGGLTAFYNSLIYGASLFGTPEPGDAVYAITDGGDNESNSGKYGVERELQSKGVRLFAFDLSHRNFSTEEEEAGHNNLRRLTEMTGGATISMASLPAGKEGERLNADLRGLYEAMERFYILQVEAPTLEKESRWKLEALDADGGKRKDVEVAYPGNLGPCSAPNAGQSKKAPS